MDEWVSEEKPHLIKYLYANREYELVERKPADGYVTAESIVFTVKDTMEVQKVKMEDDVTKVRISKTDITTCEEIPGAKLTIFDEEGNVVKTWTSEEEPHYIEMLPIGKYVLREELAPDGYLRAEDVKFTVKETGEIQKVAMVDAPKETKTSTPSSGGSSSTPKGGSSTPSSSSQRQRSNPETGDTTNVVLWVVLMIVAGVFAGSFWYVKREMDKDDKKSR